MTIPKDLILISGSLAATPFLTRVSEKLKSLGANVAAVSAGGPPASYPGWAEVSILVAFGVPCDAATINAGRALRAIIVPSLGFEGVDVDAATRARVVVANGRVWQNIESVAEAAIGLMLLGLYDIRSAERRLRNNTSRMGPPTATMLKGKKIGIIGFGNIARAIVQRLDNWGVDFLVNTRKSMVDAGPTVTCVDLETLLCTSDIVIPLLPLTEETNCLLDRTRLLRIKEGAMLINCSRGGVIDETALADPLVASRFRCLALDVFEIEPLPVESPLRDLPNAILTGHEIAHTSENLAALFDLTVTNVCDALHGRLPSTALNPQVGMQSRINAEG